MFGNLTPRAIRSGGRTRTDIGPIPMSAGLGFRMRISAGQPIITAAGFAWKIMDGVGSLVMSGDRPGFRGGQAEITWVGLHYLRQAAAKSYTKAGQLPNMSTSILESARPITT